MPINVGNNKGNEDAMGVGTITKQNTTQDVKPGETQRQLKKLQAEKLAQQKTVLITEDYNVAHKEIDIARPKANQHSAGFSPQERKSMDDFI